MWGFCYCCVILWYTQGVSLLQINVKNIGGGEKQLNPNLIISVGQGPIQEGLE